MYWRLDPCNSRIASRWTHYPSPIRLWAITGHILSCLSSTAHGQARKICSIYSLLHERISEGIRGWVRVAHLSLGRECMNYVDLRFRISIPWHNLSKLAVSQYASSDIRRRDALNRKERAKSFASLIWTGAGTTTKTHQSLNLTSVRLALVRTVNKCHPKLCLLHKQVDSFLQSRFLIMWSD